MPVTTTCPYCRTSFPVENPAAQRAVCPKCGETVSVKAVAQSAPLASTAPAPSLTSPKWFKPALYASCVAAVVILVVGLWLIYSGDRKPIESPPSSREQDGIRPPISLAGLGYLPGSTQVIVAVRPGPLVAIGDATRTDPKQKLAEVGLPKPVLDAVDRLGVPLTQIDHFAVGLVLSPDNTYPRVVAVLVLSKPQADEAAWWKGIGAERVSGGEHPRYKATFGVLPVHAVRAEPTVYVFATEPKDLDGLDQSRPTNGDHLRPALWDMLGEPAKSCVVRVGGCGGGRTLDRPAFVKFAAKFSKREDLLPAFAPGRAVAIGLSMEPDPVLRVAVKADDAKRVRDWFGQQFASEEGTQVETGDGWAAVNTPCPIAEVPARLGKLVPAMKK